MDGATTVNGTPLLKAPFTDTTTLPVVAPNGTGAVMLVSLQLEGEADVPLNRSAPVAADEPKLLPLTVTAVPTGPDVGLIDVIAGGEVVAAGLNETIESAIWLDSEYEKLVERLEDDAGPFIVMSA